MWIARNRHVVDNVHVKTSQSNKAIPMIVNNVLKPKGKQYVICTFVKSFRYMHDVLHKANMFTSENVNDNFHNPKGLVYKWVPKTL